MTKPITILNGVWIVSRQTTTPSCISSKKYRKNCRISKGNIVKGDDDAATVFCYFLWFFFQLTIKTKVKKKWNSKQTKNVKNEQFEGEQEKKIYKNW